jgi:alpha-beta hydrolase superfamily lysophospholipase
MHGAYHPLGKIGSKWRYTMHQPNGVEFATTRLRTGVTLHYAEQGDPTGEAIISLHGYSDSWYSFSRVLRLLSTEYHAFALTQRGHGDSDKPQCCYTPGDFAADVEAFMEAVGIESDHRRCFDGSPFRPTNGAELPPPR